MIKKFFFLANIFFFCFFFSTKSFAINNVVADLSEDLVKVTTKFNGAELLLFGAIDEKADIVITVRGPRKDYEVRKKVRKKGVWLSDKAVVIKKVPSFYSVVSNKNIFKESVFLDYELLKRINNNLKEYRNAIFNTQKRNSLFTKRQKKVSIIEGRLFRADIRLPSNAPLGEYVVNIYLLKNKRVINKRTIPLTISQVGIEAKISQFSHDNPFLYGFLCVLIAMTIGFIANKFFSKR
jgi:uncharacterized protein (TIGR02186 family)